MAKDIAVFIGEDGQTAALDQQGKVIVYRKKRDFWNAIREKEINLDPALGLKELRRKVEELIFFLGESRIFVGRSVTGMPFYTLEKAGFNVWEFEGKPGLFLDYILEKEEEEAAAATAKEAPVIPLPVDLGEGRFSFNLKEVQENELGFTSKQCLLPFLRQGKFFSLEVTCSHVPPWLEQELLKGNLVCETEQVKVNEYRLLITKKVCGE